MEPITSSEETKSFSHKVAFSRIIYPNDSESKAAEKFSLEFKNRASTDGANYSKEWREGYEKRHGEAWVHWSDRYPDVAAEADGWDPSIRGIRCKERVPIKCPKCGLKRSVILKERICGYSKRMPDKAVQCVGCSGFRVHPGINCLQSRFPEIARFADFDSRKVAFNSSKSLRFNCDKCGGKFTGPVRELVPVFNLMNRPCCKRDAAEKSRALNAATLSKTRSWMDMYGCRKPSPGKDLASLCPEIAAEAHGWDASTVSRGARVDRIWKCAKGHIYKMRVAHRTCVNKLTGKPHGCSECYDESIVKWDKDSVTSSYPEVALEVVNWNIPRKKGKSRGVARFGFMCPSGHRYNDFLFKQMRGKLKRVVKKHGVAGCPYCNGVKLKEGFNDLKTKHPELAVLCRGVDPSKVRHKSITMNDWDWPCGHDYKMSPGYRLKMNIGPSRLCPTCDNRNGFRKGLPAYLYLITRPGQFQFGVTNRPEKRIHFTHKRNGWELIDFKYSLFGEPVLKAELSIKRALKARNIPTGKKAFREKFDGWTETFQDCDLRVSSLKELFIKLSITLPEFLSM